MDDLLEGLQEKRKLILNHNIVSQASCSLPLGLLLHREGAKVIDDSFVPIRT